MAMTNRRNLAFGTLLGAMVCLGGGFLVAQFVAARNVPAANACINNLRQLDAAQQQWTLENPTTTNDRPTWEQISPYLLGGRRRLVCPQGGTYSLSRTGDHPKCSLGPPRHAVQ